MWIFTISKIVILPIVAILWYIGGGHRTWVRDLLIPIIIGTAVFLNQPTDILWQNILIGILTIAACNMIRLGYGAYDPINDDKPSLLAKITKDKDGWWIRAIWGAICGTVSCIPQAIFVHSPVEIIKYISFIIIFSAICFTVVRLKLRVFPTDMLIGAAFALRIFV